MYLTLILTVLTVVVCYYIINIWRHYRRMWKHAIHIPGPEGVPFLGNLPFVTRAIKNGTFREERFQHCLQYKYIHRYYVLSVFIGTHIYNPDDIETILTDMNQITKGTPYKILHPWLGTGLLTSTGSKWQTRRKIITPAFHFSILQDFLEIFNRETENLVETLKISAGQPVDVVKPITEFTLSSIGETSLGIKINEEKNSKEYKTAIHDFGEILVVKSTEPWLNFPIIKQLHSVERKVQRAVKVLHSFSQNVITKRKQQIELSPGSYSMKKRLALLDLLLKAKAKGVDIDDDGIREEVDTFMFEGHDTTAVALCYTLIVLANEQKIQEEVYQEIMDIMGDEKKYPNSKDLANMTFMERCIKETLRLYPSVPNILRKITEDVKTKDGYILPKGLEVDIAIFELHRMPHLWENPYKFDPDRFLPENISTRHPFAYIPFSAGPRNCIGQKYAIMELKAAVCGILKAFKLEPITKVTDLKFKLDMVLRPLEELNVKFIPRVPQ